MNTEEWIDAWLSRHSTHDADKAWEEVEAWANENESVGRWTEIGAAYRRLELFECAQAAFKSAIKFSPAESRGLAYSNYANFLLELKEFEEALAVFELAWELQRLPSVGLGLSSALLEARADAKAMEFLMREEESLKELAGYWSNRSIAHTRLGAYEDARTAAGRAYSISDSPENRFQLSLAMLRVPGDASQFAWDYFDARPNKPNYSQSFGEELTSTECVNAGDRVVVFCEQGIGDILQFIRFVSELESSGARVVLAGPPRMEPLLTQSFPSFSYVRSPGEALKLRPKFWVPLLSLPRILKIEKQVLAHEAYLIPPATSFEMPPRRAQVRIGLAWKGNPTYPNDHLRSAVLSDFKPLLEEDRCEVYSLLMSTADDLQPSSLIPLPSGIDEKGVFADTASLVSSLDAVVSTDTSLAHLSAGLGIPTYLLLNKGADWRWGTPENPVRWYDSMKLFWLDDSGFRGGAQKVLDAILSGQEQREPSQDSR